MPDPENVAAVVSEWVDKPENDLKTPAHTLSPGKDCPTEFPRKNEDLKKQTRLE